MGRNGRGWEKREPPRSDVDLMNDDETAPACLLARFSLSGRGRLCGYQPAIYRPTGRKRSSYGRERFPTWTCVLATM